LHQRIKQLLYNGASPKKGEPKLRHPINRFITIHTLFKQHYTDCIVKCQDSLLTLDPELKKFNMYNKAVKIEFQALKDDSLEEFEQLEQTVVLMCDCYTSCLGYSLKLKDDLNTNISYWKDIQQYAQTS
jgi:hypothetical protein